MIAVRPDPARPQGGYALLELDGAAVAGDQVGVEVFDNYAARYLGEKGWQAEKVTFGPYAVARQGDRAVVTIGPEIVNQLEEYQPVRLHVGPVRADVSWPDDVVPAPGEAVLGGIWTAPPVAHAAASNLVGRAATPAETAAEELAAVPAPDEFPAEPAVPGPAPAAEPERRRRLPLILAGLALLALIAGGGYLLLSRQDEPEIAALPDPVPDAPAQSSAPQDPCAIEALTTLGEGGFAPVAAQLRQCGNAVTADDALSLLETASRTGDPDALTLFGRIYDGESTDPEFEEGIGLTFGDNAASAADYYAQAKAAGSDEAATLLDALCRRMMLMNDTLTQSAYEDHCET